MKTVTDAFLNTIRGTHTAVFRATVCSTYQTTTTPTGVVIPILDGEVTLDSTADYWGMLDLVTGVGTDETAWPAEADSMLAPYGNEIYVERGAMVNAAPEYVGLGYFRIDDVQQDRPPNGPLVVAASDRWAGIAEARLEAPQQFAADATYGGCIDLLVLAVYPDCVIEWDDDSDALTIDRQVVYDSERGDAIRDLVMSLGKVAHFDHRGALVIATPPSEWVEAFAVTHGVGGVLVGLNRRLTREGVFNAVVATGEALDDLPPAYAVVHDTTANSPTMWGGRFGKVPRFYASPLLTTDAQALAAATTILRKGSGLAYSVDFSTIVNPAMEPLDVGRIGYSDDYPDERHMIQSITIPLTAQGLSSAVTRQREVEL